MLTLNTDLSTDLHRLGRELGITLKAIFLSAYLDLIGMKQKQDAATVGVVSNGRSERLSDPLSAVGLYWNIVPFFCRLDFHDHLSQLRNVQKQLVEIERYAAYPLTRIMEEQRKRNLFFASFNFIHFHNAKEIVQLTGMEILDYRSHDKFHFPLNYIVSLNPSGIDVSLRVEYDKLYFSGKSIESLSADYIKFLGDFASLGAKE